MPDRLPPLATLRAFEAVVRLGSVTAAAEALGRTHGAVSKQIRSLQIDAGLPLFDKVGVGLKPNAAGARLAQVIACAFEDLAAAYGEVIRQGRSPEVRVACSATFAMRWLVPHMAAFTQAHPQVRIRLSMTSAREMRDEHDADLIVLWDRRNLAPEDQARAIRLADAAFGLVAAPGCPVTALDDSRLFVQTRLAHDFTARAWEVWEARSGISLGSEITRSFPHTHLCIEAAVAGLGVALVERRLVAPELADGRLLQHSAFVAFADGFAAVPHRTRPLSAEAQAFLDWLAQSLQRDSQLAPI
jgi:DNA-binding transcriptional LysR family regulator